MLNYLIKILITIIFSFIIMFFYYKVFPAQNGFFSHLMNFDGYIYYIIPLLIFYGIYKFFKSGNKKEEVKFSLYELLGYFLLNLFILSIFFFGVNEFKSIDREGVYGALTGIVLFFKIIGFSIIPTILIFLSISFGRKISKIFGVLKDDKEEGIYNFLLSLGLGFFLFLFFITIIGLVGFYNLFTIISILFLFIIFSYKEIGEIFNKFINYRITFDNHDLEDKSLIKNINFKLLTTEFLFIVAGIILAINLISIMRPMPIGWDDLGAYMNLPRQMVYYGIIDFVGGMYSWQLFTGIGFMISEPVQAFFLNSVGGFLSFIVMILIISDLLKDKLGKIKTLINIPLLLATIFISMPMIIFQQAKDMKLDPGLFFVSIIALYLLIKLFISHKNKEEDKNISKNKEEYQNKEKEEKKKVDFKASLKIIFIIGILAGFAFSIKVTSLLLISALIGVIFYSKLGFSGLLGYIGIYSALFTKVGLWSYLNIVYDKTNIEGINSVSLVFLIFGILFLILGFIKHRKDFLQVLFYVGIFLLGILIALLPWIGKNIYQAKVAGVNISVGTLIGGYTQSFRPDFTKIHSAERLEQIKEEKAIGRGLDASGVTTNEDFGRYFGYELGINNYIKLPWNLTMQINQGGEFTNITWLFLAFIPLLFIFLQYKRRGLEYVILVFLLFTILLHIYNPGSEFLTNIFSQIKLPLGYLVLFLMGIIPIIFLLFSLKNNKVNKLFKLILVFSFIYIFLFAISSFGIVWYGIVMYFSLLLLIGIALFEISKYRDDDSEKKKEIKLFGSFIIFILFLVYFFLSVFPHSFTNLKSAGYQHFKAGTLEAQQAVFAYNPYYKKILFSLNIDQSKLEKDQREITFQNLLRPSEEIQSEEKIYRVGTFLKYFIIGNYKRLLGDNLLITFDTYIFDERGANYTVENMKKLGIEYLLVDLNAATIDNDPRRDLTRRYENLLKTFTSDKLKLIETNSICLRLALEDFSKSNKTKQDLKNYILMAGVNHHSYPEKNKIISKQNKLKFCTHRIQYLLINNKVDKNNFSYLQGIKPLKDGSKVLFDGHWIQLPRTGSKVLFEIR